MSVELTFFNLSYLFIYARGKILNFTKTFNILLHVLDINSNTMSIPHENLEFWIIYGHKNHKIYRYSLSSIQ